MEEKQANRIHDERFIERLKRGFLTLNMIKEYCLITNQIYDTFCKRINYKLRKDREGKRIEDYLKSSYPAL